VNGRGVNLLELLGLTPVQQSAVLCQAPVVLVTAGAGCGKTRTLVGRYLWAVAQGAMPRRLAAITFTEKAAREMRNRVRVSVRQVLEQVVDEEERDIWQGAAAQMDGARIGTIHSLCAELLHAHPAEAGIDPEFSVLDEGLAAAVRASVVQDSIAWAAGEEDLVPLFEMLSLRRTAELVDAMLTQRLDLAAAVASPDGVAGLNVVHESLLAFMEHPDVVEAQNELRGLLAGGRLIGDAGDKLAEQVELLLGSWQDLADELTEHQVLAAAVTLFNARRGLMALNIGRKTSTAKEMTRQLRAVYDERIAPWLGGTDSKDPLPNGDLEERFPKDAARLMRIFKQSRQLYLNELEQRRALDFDGLEAGALALLQDPQIRTRWQEKLDLVLVDEFQDTNARQRDILQALTENRATRLFLVGDARQSIYRFRGADVTVFRQMELDTAGGGGSVVNLDSTFRAHERLLRTLDVLVGRPMAVESGQDALYWVQYTPLQSSRPLKESFSPSVSLVLGTGASAEDARPVSAAALADFLLLEKQEHRIQEWDDVALLFRASTGFPAYEQAFEERGIPFVTIAGKGFYERPEVRDVLNLLAALASPWDDAALAGLLRSPAVGLSDPGLYQVRLAGGPGSTLYETLPTMQGLSESDEQARLRALELIGHFQPLVDRDPVAVLLKAVLDWLDYRPMLASTAARLWRNMDKLVEDARASGLVQVRAFLDYVRTLRDVGVREGEAPAQAEGAVRLMTIHKAKGLEFPVVVLADASRRAGGGNSPFYLLPQTGFVFNPDLSELQPLLFRFARWINQQQEQAEELRLLYVAATRAREQLVVSGFLSEQRSRWTAQGWTGLFLETIGLDPGEAAGLQQRLEITMPNDEQLQVWTAGALPQVPHLAPEQEPVREGRGEPALFAPLPVEDPDTDDPEETERDWRATGQVYAPASAVGTMVHAALRSWLFPGDAAPEPRLRALLEGQAYAQGLVDERQRRFAVHKAVRLLERFRAHPLWTEIEGADERYFEAAYSVPRAEGSRIDSGRLDVLFRRGTQWFVVDYKTDELHNHEEIAQAVLEYREQVERYRHAVRSMLQVDPQVQLCFLDAMESVHLELV